MVQKPKAVKYKVVTGYVLLFAMAALSVWLVYTEISKIGPGQSSDDNKTIIRISNTVANLYSSEAMGRKAILSENDSDFKKYNQLINNISREIDSIKTKVEESQVPKFDSIQLLLNRKRNSVLEIIAYHKKYEHKNPYTRAIEGIYDTKDSLVKSGKPVQVTTRYKWQKTINDLLTQRAKDSLGRPAVSNDSLAMAFDKILTNLLYKEKQIDYQLFQKEQKLLQENRIISDQIREILISVEKEFLQKTYDEIKKSESVMQKTIENVAWIGAITFLILIVFAWIILRDLTINQNHRKQLEILNLKNEELLRTKSMLMATVTHDLQTPLGSIIGFHDLIKDSGITGKQKQYLGNIKESANYILKLVNDLLDFSKLENNRISIEKTGFNIKSVIENTCRTLEPMALNKGIELNWDISEELNANYVSDPYRIKQVLTNLVSNAIKFTPEGSVEITGKIEDDNIHISVIDTGIGISKAKHADVFKEFTQAHSGIEKKFGGTGLGLTISKKILELLGGEIVLESEEGQGSIFTIIIPCIPAANTFIPNKESTIAEDNERYRLLKGKKILIIDDDNMQLTLMKELLLNYPIEITTEINAASVIAILENKPFDLILTDIQMPSIDGFELVKLIRSNPNNHIVALPVIALSGKRDLVSKDFTDGGFNGHHPKPIQLEQLLDMISTILSGQTTDNVVSREEDTETTGPSPLYNLRSLAQFTYNDAESLKTILRTFIESAKENCIALKVAVKNHSEQELSETAHKMIPMLKQMEVHSIVELLVPLEDMTYDMDWTELDKYVDDACDRLNELCDAFTEEIN